MADLKPLLNELLNDLQIAIRTAIVSKSPSLKDSDLVNNIELKVIDNSIEIWADDYYDFVNKGRRSGAKKVPIEFLIKWIKDKGLKGRDKKGRFISINSLAFAIQTAIFKAGIRGKFFDASVDQTIDQVVDIILDERALEVITKELDSYFNN